VAARPFRRTRRSGRQGSDQRQRHSAQPDRDLSGLSASSPVDDRPEERPGLGPP